MSPQLYTTLNTNDLYIIIIEESVVYLTLYTYAFECKGDDIKWPGIY